MPPDEHGARLPAEDSVMDLDDSLLRAVAELSEPPSGVLPQRALSPNDVVGGRFLIEGKAGSGGMGTIYRATDLHTQQVVAIKVMRLGVPERFAQEAVVLAGLSHPAVVRYIAHGTTPMATQFMAMEWLEGEDLSERLARSPLRAADTLQLLRRACAGVAAAHARGVVHRDLKPSNLFLVDRDPAQLKVLDFGIARLADNTRALTQSGTVLGTVGYMAPEQAMGARDVDARADVFALGCVLFECLTGRAAFVGPNAVAVLAKVLREQPPAVSELKPGLGKALDRLVARLLDKNPDARPNDAAALLRALDEIELTSADTLLSAPLTVGLTASEQHIVSVVLGTPREGQPEPRSEQGLDLGRAQEVARRFGAEPVAMRGGGLLVVLSGKGAATDQARLAARCALLLARALPLLRIAVATGRAETRGRISVGDAIDRAAELLARSDAAGVAIDELTAGLLDPSFELRRDTEQRLVVSDQRADLDTPCRLMGKVTPLVGRDKELGMLDLMLRECIDESVPRAVLVTGPPGQGKSRLRHEFVANVRARGDVRILIARADAIGAGSAFMLARQLVRGAVGLRDGERASEQYARLRAYVAALCSGAHAERTAEFLGELVGAPCSERPSPELRAAQYDPQIMSVWLRRSFADWLSAECAERPLLLVLEDLHWGDLPSVTYLGEALCALDARPLMVLALARTEVHDVFPKLWAGAQPQLIALGRLTPRAAERLVRVALGEQPAHSAVSRIVERADGNAFYLEELIRCAAEGGGTNLPETALALVQSRLEGLAPEARRIARAASLLGEIFWPGAVRAVLGTAPSGGDLDAWLRILLDAEILRVAPDSRFPDQIEYTFRHSLLHEAAYGMLTDADRITGHRLVGDWLEHAGEKDALRLANHFQRGAEPARAVGWLELAAQAALDGGNVGDALALVERGIACGAFGVELGRLRLVQARVLSMRGDWRECADAQQQALELFAAGSTPWFTAAAGLLLSGSFLGDTSVSNPALQSVLSVPVQPEASGPYGYAAHCACQGLIQMGKIESARSFVERIEALARVPDDCDPIFVMWLRMSRAYLDLVSGDLGAALRGLTESRALADRHESALGRSTHAGFFAQALCEAGDVGRLEALARETHTLLEPDAMRSASAWTTFFLAKARALTGRADEAIAPLRALLDHPDVRLVLSARGALGWSYLAIGDAELVGRGFAASDEKALFAIGLSGGLAIQAWFALHSHDPQTALAHATRGLDAAARASQPFSRAALRLARAEAQHALGQLSDARDSIRQARDHLLLTAATLDDPEQRDGFLCRILLNARTLRLASEWLGEVVA